MINKKQKIFIFLTIGFIAAFLSFMPAFAHLPRFPDSKFIEVKNPETSQAFYDELTGVPVFYRINSDQPFKFYVNILQPDIEGVKETISVDIFKDIDEKANKTFVALLNGKKFSWNYFYEPFAGDGYWQGPEFKKDVNKGVYTIRVFNSKDRGKYALTIGEQEKFALGETINTIRILPSLKNNYFNKSPWTAYFNYTGLFMLVFLIIMLLFVMFLIWLGKKVLKGKRV